MKFMAFTDDQQPFYSDENEHIIFRVKDAKELIAEQMHVPVTRLLLMGSQDDPEILRELYEDLMPERVWHLEATFETPDGTKKAEVFLMLKDHQLILPKRIFPRLEVFLSAQREQAKQAIPDLALDYILTLEETTEVAWRFWRDFLYYARKHPNEPIRDLVGAIRREMNGAYTNLQRVNFLQPHDEEELRDPFHGSI